MKYLKLHALDNVDFNDGELTYSDLFTNKSIEYLPRHNFDSGCVNRWEKR